ncbi:MAG: histidine kinase [Micrococcales bacterium]|nr:histidine kinase [Micrococcales bacterium]
MTISATAGCLVLVGVLVVVCVGLSGLLVTERRARDRRTAITSQTERARIAELAVATERNRIVREMHDVIAHSLAIMIAQADGGCFAAADTDKARRTFTTIAETGRGALVDTRRILGMLRNPAAAADFSPTPDADDIDALVKRAEATGLPVALISVGEPVTLPSAASLALFRICQEAITNVIKHAGSAAPCVVTQSWRADDVVLSVTNENTRPVGTVPVGGQGLVGMRERAELVGGELTVDQQDGRFQVRAVIPYSAPEGWDE